MSKIAQSVVIHVEVAEDGEVSAENRAAPLSTPRCPHPGGSLYFDRHEVRDEAETSCWSDASRLFFPHTALCVAVLFL